MSAPPVLDTSKYEGETTKKITDEEILNILEQPVAKASSAKSKNKKKKKKKPAKKAAAEEEDEDEESNDED